jgi:ribosomal protein S1
LNDDLKVSLRLAKNTVVDPTALAVGDIVSGKVLSTSDNKVIVILDNDLNASISYAHLSDVCDEVHTAKLAACYKEGHILEDCLVLSIEKWTNEIVLTRKSSLVEIAQAGGYAKDVASLEVGQSHAGFVKKIMEHGAIVGFVGGLQGFARIYVSSCELII